MREEDGAGVDGTVAEVGPLGVVVVGLAGDRHRAAHVLAGLPGKRLVKLALDLPQVAQIGPLCDGLTRRE